MPRSARRAEKAANHSRNPLAPPRIQSRLGKLLTSRNPDRWIDPGRTKSPSHRISKITPHEGTPLKLQKQLFTKVNTNKGPTLQPCNGSVSVGDELVQRIILRTDRDMEYVHLKDQRGSGTEPTNVLSKYKYQDGLGYYQMTRDTASHFYIDYLPKGVYVFEYSVRVQHKGEYQSAPTANEAAAPAKTAIQLKNSMLMTSPPVIERRRARANFQANFQGLFRAGAGQFTDQS